MDEEKQITSSEDKKDVKVFIEVSRDKVEVYITLIPLSESPEFTTEQIRKALSDRGIKFGIKEEVIVLLEKDIKYNERLLIASGTQQTEGKDGTIEFFFESNKTVKVKKSEKIGEIIHPEEGVEGMTVFEEKIPAPIAQKAKIPNLTNVGLSPENEDILIAEIDGYLFISQFNIQLTPFFELELPADKCDSYVKVKKPLNECDLNSEDLKRFITENGIVYGILKEEIENIFKQEIFDKYNERLLIASGTRPTEGKDGTIEYFFENNKTVKVKKSEKIGEIIHPEQWIDGMTVFEEKIPAQKTQKKAKIPNLTNVGLSPENEDILIAEIDGYLFIDQSNLKLTPFFELEVSDDKYDAYIKAKKPLNEGDFNSADLQRFLTEKGIVYGILEEEIENIFKQKIFEKSILVAQGRKVVNEKDIGIKYYFDTELKPKRDEWGILDLKELNFIQQVRSGDKLAETNPPEQGVEGLTIFDEKIPPKKGVQPPLPIGKNAKPDPNNLNVLLSEIDGSVKLKGTTVEVESVITVKKNVDYSTGNIDFDGPVIVNGDVISGFKIKSKNDVQVNGIVEDAVIETEGNVLLKNGFIGRGKGQIIAQGNVTAKFCENETIITEGDIYISEYVMHSKIQTKGNLFITEKTGLIVGGETYAVKGIEANIVGNENYTHTAIFAGVDKEFNEKLKVTKAHLKENIKHIKDIERILHKFSQRELIKKRLSENKKNQMIKFNQFRNEKEVKKRYAIAEIKELESKIEEFKKAVVKIFGDVYPGTLITIYDKHLLVNEPNKSVYYIYTEEELVAIDLEGV